VCRPATTYPRPSGKSRVGPICVVARCFRYVILHYAVRRHGHAWSTHVNAACTLRSSARLPNGSKLANQERADALRCIKFMYCCCVTLSRVREFTLDASNLAVHEEYKLILQRGKHHQIQFVALVCMIGRHVTRKHMSKVSLASCEVVRSHRTERFNDPTCVFDRKHVTKQWTIVLYLTYEIL
jgi:hypothetical protein